MNINRAPSSTVRAAINEHLLTSKNLKLNWTFVRYVTLVQL